MRKEIITRLNVVLIYLLTQPFTHVVMVAVAAADIVLVGIVLGMEVIIDMNVVVAAVVGTDIDAELVVVDLVVMVVVTQILDDVVTVNVTQYSVDWTNSLDQREKDY